MWNCGADGKVVLFLRRRFVRGDLVLFLSTLCCLCSACVSFMKRDLLSLPDGSCVCLAIIRWPVLCSTWWFVQVPCALFSCKKRPLMLSASYFSHRSGDYSQCLALDFVRGPLACHGCYYPSAWHIFKVWPYSSLLQSFENFLVGYPRPTSIFANQLSHNVDSHNANSLVFIPGNMLLPCQHFFF